MLVKVWWRNILEISSVGELCKFRIIYYKTCSGPEIVKDTDFSLSIVSRAIQNREQRVHWAKPSSKEFVLNDTEDMYGVY